MMLKMFFHTLSLSDSWAGAPQNDMCYAKVCGRRPTDHTLSTFN